MTAPTAFVALLLDRDRVGRAQILLDEAEHFLLERALSTAGDVARLLRGLLGQLDDRLDHRLEVAVAEHHGAEHDVFGQLLGFRLDHQHGVGGAGDDEIELGLDHFVERRVEHVFVVDEADARRADRAHEGRAGKRQRGGGGDHRQDVGIVFQVVRQHGDDDLGLVAPAVGEQRTDRAVDQAGNQRLLFGRAAFALEVAAGNAAGGVGFFLIVDGERKEVDAFARRLGGDDGREHGGLAVGGEHGAVGLAGDLAGFKLERAPTPVEFDRCLLNIVFVFHRFTKAGRHERKDHAQDGGTLAATMRCEQRPAILPWSSDLEWRPSFRWYGHLTRHRPAAGLLLDTLARA